MLPTVTAESIRAPMGVGLYFATLTAAVHLSVVNDDHVVVWHVRLSTATVVVASTASKCKPTTVTTDAKEMGWLGPP
jgi:hypothetical protein